MNLSIASSDNGSHGTFRIKIPWYGTYRENLEGKKIVMFDIDVKVIMLKTITMSENIVKADLIFLFFICLTPNEKAKAKELVLDCLSK